MTLKTQYEFILDGEDYSDLLKDIEEKISPGYMSKAESKYAGKQVDEFIHACASISRYITPACCGDLRGLTLILLTEVNKIANAEPFNALTVLMTRMCTLQKLIQENKDGAALFQCFINTVATSVCLADICFLEGARQLKRRVGAKQTLSLQDKPSLLCRAGRKLNDTLWRRCFSCHYLELKIKELKNNEGVNMNESIKYQDEYRALIKRINKSTPDYFDNQCEWEQRNDFQDALWGISGTDGATPVMISDLILILLQEAELAKDMAFKALIANNTAEFANETRELYRMMQENIQGTDLMKCYTNVNGLAASLVYIAVVHEYQQRETGEIKKGVKTIAHTAASILYKILHSCCLCSGRLELKIKENKMGGSNVIRTNSKK
jgi:hypothetical protein